MIYMTYFLLTIFVIFFVSIVLNGAFSFKRERENLKIINNLSPKKSSLYIKYNINTKDISINNYKSMDLELGNNIVSMIKDENFIKEIKKLVDKETDKFETAMETSNLNYNCVFYYKDKFNDNVIIKCECVVSKKNLNVEINNLDSIKKIHEERKNKKATFYHLNIKDFNAVNQRYGQKCGDYVLNVLKCRLLNLQNKFIATAYLGEDQFAIYCKTANKRIALATINVLNRKLTRPIDIGNINIDLTLGIGICIGDYEKLEDLSKGAYIASEYAKERKKYNIVIYSEHMKMEENNLIECEKELEKIIAHNEIKINYTPVVYYGKNRFIGFIGNPSFSDKQITFEKVKSCASQKGTKDLLINTYIENQLTSYLKKRTNKTSKIFIELRLEELSNFLEVYLSNEAYSECKIVIILNIKKGYEMINKISNIGANITKLIDMGISFALKVNYSNIYEYDYMLKNADYLILESDIIKNMNNSIIKTKAMNIMEIANHYNLSLIATGIDEYIELEGLLKYEICYFSGSYFGENINRPSDAELLKTKIFGKITKKSKKDKK